MFILPAMKDHLLWETTFFSGHLIKTSFIDRITIPNKLG